MICFFFASLFFLFLFPDAVFAQDIAFSNLGVESLSMTVAVLIALSVASERLVEIIKGWIPYLNKALDDPGKEGRRKAVLQTMAVFSGIGTALLAQSAIISVLPDFNTLPHILALGLLASGGSGFWNSFNSYVMELKNFKKEMAKLAKEGKITSA